MTAERSPRSSLSRAYYAAYAACCGWFEQLGLEPEPTTEGNELWFPHARIADYLAQVMDAWPDNEVLLGGPARALIEAMSRLRKLRVDADYHPAVNLQPADAHAGYHHAALVIAAIRTALRYNDDQG